MAAQKQPSARAGARRRGRDHTNEVINGIRRLDRGLRVIAREVQRSTGLSATQLFVLKQLLESPCSSLNELASTTMTDRSSVSVVVDRLVAAGLATRRTAAEDRRRAEVRITAAGRAMLDRAPPAPTDILLRGLGALPRSILKSLGAALTTLNERLGFHEADLLFSDVAD